MTTLLFNVDEDPRLYAHERKYLRELSVALTRRADVQEYDRCKPADPRALQAQHHRVDRGDL